VLVRTCERDDLDLEQLAYEPHQGPTADAQSAVGRLPALVGRSWEMRGNDPKLVSRELIRSDLDALVNEGLWDASPTAVANLSQLALFGGSDAEPVPLAALRPAFREFVKTNDEMAGALSQMAIRLFGIEAPYRDQTPVGRITEMGKVPWHGKTVLYDAARRKDGRREKVLDRIVSTILSAEEAMQESLPTDDTPGELVPRTQPMHPDAPVPPSRRLIALRRWPVALGLLMAACGVALAIAVGGLEQQHADTPTVSLGTAPKHSRGGPNLHEDEMSSILLDACTPASGCRTGSGKQPVIARPEDPVSFRLHIYESYREPIKTIKLLASMTAHGDLVEVSISAEWTIPLPLGALESRTVVARVRIDGATPKYLPSLKYLVGTTQLYARLAGNTTEEVLARSLPDGLFTPSGLTLKEVGAQRTCYGCTPVEAGSIHFEMRATREGLND
jgi:hypothetical protein